MSLLFEEPAKPEPQAETPVAGGHCVGVAVNANVWDAYDYHWPEHLGQPVVGQRVRVPFGRGDRKVLGFITSGLRPAGKRRLKSVAELVDPQPQLDENLWELGQWINSYYLTPLGMTLSAMVPSAVGSHATKTETVVYLNKEPQDWPSSLGPKQRVVLDELLEARKQGVEPLPLESLLNHSKAGRDTIRRLRMREFIRTDIREVNLEDLQRRDDEAPQADPFNINEDQRAVLKKLLPKLTSDEFSVSLLHGVTGSGKTEVYVRAIRKVIESGKQAIMLTPEIALATQTLQRLLARLPRVAVLHSGLTNSQRAYYWQQIRDGHASLVVGPRSAIFAPVKRENLGLIIVDEEHESSYKQDTAPRYHGRDVAVKRASLAGVPIILGSATPSMESMNNANKGKYELLSLPNRVMNLPMPRLEIVHLRREMAKGKVELLGRTLSNRMAEVIERGEQIILLMNRRGYASYVFCPSCNWMMECEDCVRPMVWHQATQLCCCHHCNKTAQLPEFCPACKGKLLLFGYGIQRIEDELARKFPMARVARMDSDTMTSPRQFQKVFKAFSEGEVDILLGTQIVAKGLDFPKVSLVGVASADTSLAVHDFRASERTFQLIVQVAGRAGRAGTAGQVIVQTLHAEEPAIQFAEHHDYKGFAEYELTDREGAMYPPFSRMVRFVCRHERADTANDAALELANLLRATLPQDQVMIVGPQPAEFVKIRNQYRFHVLIITPHPGLVQKLLYARMAEILRSTKAEIYADVDPINLL